ncbi:hypothetical protein [Kitasatospora sp. NPDC088351]|uniref:hypothetical protein n=1 Tax=Kitasatospora sp. NPDC088351 TaxID=3155180 RepID=UPI00342D7189
MNRHILITGTTGFIGTAATRAALRTPGRRPCPLHHRTAPVVPADRADLADPHHLELLTDSRA